MPDGATAKRYRTIWQQLQLRRQQPGPHHRPGRRPRPSKSSEVHWPTSKTTQVFKDIPLDTALTVTEGADGYQKLDWTPTLSPR